MRKKTKTKTYIQQTETTADPINASIIRKPETLQIKGHGKATYTFTYGNAGFNRTGFAGKHGDRSDPGCDWAMARTGREKEQQNATTTPILNV
eukprot:6482078-Amphidinium_carterae.1